MRFRPLLLCYHAVTEGEPHRLAVRRSALERQVRSVLVRGRRPATAAQTLAGRGRLVHVTFDDAFRSVRLALPALERMRVPVTVFACSGRADEGRALDIPELAEDVARARESFLTMTWDDLRELAERGIEIGSHTVSHPHLTRLPDAELDRELTESRERIEDELGRRCPLVAYPFGDDDERVHAAARRAGYDAGFALPGRVSPVDRYALPRVGLYRKDNLARAVFKTSTLGRAAIRLLR